MNREDRRAHAARSCPCGSGKKYRNCCEPAAQRVLTTLAVEARCALASLPDWGELGVSP